MLLVAVPAVQVLRDAILLVQERLLVHLVEQTALASPRGERLEVFYTLLLWPDITHLDHHERVLVRRAGDKKYVLRKARAVRP